jgi:hypothetical protein
MRRLKLTLHVAGDCFDPPTIFTGESERGQTACKNR